MALDKKTKKALSQFAKVFQNARQQNVTEADISIAASVVQQRRSLRM